MTETPAAWALTDDELRARLDEAGLSEVAHVLATRRVVAALDPYVDEGGLERHLPMPVTVDGHGPASEHDAHRYVCWCGHPRCLWTAAFAHAAELAARDARAAAGARLRAVVAGYVAAGGPTDLLPDTLTDADRGGYLNGLEAAIRLLEGREASPGNRS